MPESSSATKLPGLVYTFYSYKGGVGRSMSLVNVGVLMATEGHRVLLIDWDLEAPGLEVFFRKAAKLSREPSETAGIVDLLDAQTQGTPLSWRDCLLKAEFFGKSIDILSAGRRTDDYRRRVQQLDWDTLFREHRIGNYINTLREEWRADYDFVLVDSRTGITDIGDICTVILPDVLVLLFVTNHQNVEGIKSVMARAVKARAKLPVNRSKLLGVPVPARDERDRESDKFAIWKDIFAREFSDLYRDWLPKEVNPLDALHRIYIPYFAAWSFGESIPVIESDRDRMDPSSLGAAYARLTTLLSNRLDWSALEAKASPAEVIGARAELSKARDEAVRLAEEAKRHEEEIRSQEEKRREAEVRIKELEQAAAQSKKRGSILRWAALLFVVLALAGGYWWYATHPSPAKLAARLKDSRFSVRSDAVKKLGEMGSAAVPHLPAIADLLKDPDSSVRAAAVSALGYIAVWDRESVSKFAAEVAHLLKDSDDWVRYRALVALRGLGQSSVAFAPEIAGVLKDNYSAVRLEAVETLGELGTSATKFAPEVAALLYDEDSSVRIAATNALQKMGEEKILQNQKQQQQSK
jgi:cellulose biosynthesis protein BcsQ